jgi:hypothetical protein
MPPTAKKAAPPAKAQPAADTTEPTAADLAEQQRQADQAAAEQATQDASMGRAEAKRAADTKEERQAASRVCVVSDGTPHTGRALPGKAICSAHEMHYLPDGRSRAKVNAAAQKAAEQPGVTEIAPQP